MVNVNFTLTDAQYIALLALLLSRQTELKEAREIILALHAGSSIVPQ